MIVGVSMVKDEVDVVEGVMRHMAGEVDQIFVSDNGSTDGTREVLHELARELPLTVAHDDELAYYQSQKMTMMADAAHFRGATWVVPFDADELWWHPAGRVADVLANVSMLHPTVNVAFAELRNHFRTSLDVDDPDPFRSMVWRQAQAAPLGKVAVKWEPGAVIHQGNHGADVPSGRVDLTVLNIGHFPYRSADQFVRKAVNGAAAYKAADLPESWGAHWRSYGRIAEQHGEQALRQVFFDHFVHTSPIDSGLVQEPAPYRRWS